MTRAAKHRAGADHRNGSNTVSLVGVSVSRRFMARNGVSQADS